MGYSAYRTDSPRSQPERGFGEKTKGVPLKLKNMAKSAKAEFVTFFHSGLHSFCFLTRLDVLEEEWFTCSWIRPMLRILDS